MSTADRIVGGVAALALVGIMAYTATTDTTDDPTKGYRVFPAVQAGVTAPAVAWEAAPIEATAWPPKTPQDSGVYYVPPPPPPPVPVRAATGQPATPAATSAPAAPQRERTEQPAAPQPAPAPPRDRAAEYAAAYGCGGIRLEPSVPAGNRGWYEFGSNRLNYDPSDPQLGYVIGHECMHARQEWAYGGDIGAMVADTAGVGGFEYVADCMSKFVGAGSGGYTSSCGGGRGDAARAILNGNRYQP